MPNRVTAKEERDREHRIKREARKAEEAYERVARRGGSAKEELKREHRIIREARELEEAAYRRPAHETESEVIAPERIVVPDPDYLADLELRGGQWEDE
jgi:sensor c-di-GMP phosphodiesterase-like protein